MLAEALARQGREVVLTREPGGTAGAEAIRRLLLEPPGEGWGARAEALLFAAARADHVERLIEPALERGTWVVCDRFVDSSRAYQGGAGGLGDAVIQTLHEIGSGGRRPDRTLLIDAPPETIAQRLARRDGGSSDAIGGRDSAYHAQVGASFRALAEADREGITIIDGHAPPDVVHERVMQALAPLLEDGA